MTKIRATGEGRGDPGDEGAIHGITGARRVEVDDVQPRRTGVGERKRHGHRVVSVHRLAGVVALGQAHHLSSAQVDGRIQVDAHDRTPSTKLRNRAKPLGPDFSGWNWVATTFPRRNTALSVAPYSQVATTSSTSRGTPCNECTK